MSDLKRVMQQANKENEERALEFVTMAKILCSQDRFCGSKRCLGIALGILDSKGSMNPGRFVRKLVLSPPPSLPAIYLTSGESPPPASSPPDTRTTSPPRIKYGYASSVRHRMDSMGACRMAAASDRSTRRRQDACRF